jgi:hypothetical protein
MQRVTITVQPLVWHLIRAKNTMDSMFSTPKPILLSLLALSLLRISPAKKANVTSRESPEYTANGQLRLPERYREWVWLSFDFLTASDPANMQADEHRLFNNFFVNPEAYKAFLQTGTWPDTTMLVVEQRVAEDMGPSPNHKGISQSFVIGIDLHVKDEARFPGKWAFFDFKGSSSASAMPLTVRCYSCHAARGAADTTFVQFYPTLLPIAKSNATLNPAYLRESESVPPTTK